MNTLTVRRSLRIWLIVLLIAVLAPMCAREGYAAEQDDIVGFKEKWAMPIIVIPPPRGWNSKEGEAIKLALRKTERVISTTRQGIDGKEVVYMFANTKNADEVEQRIPQWRQMKAHVILSFATGRTNAILAKACRTEGPAVVFVEGEHIKLKTDGVVSPYLFALDLPYFAKANAFANIAQREKKTKLAAIFSDQIAKQLPIGARLTARFMGAAGIDPFPIWVPAYKQDQFIAQVNEAEKSGAKLIVSWLEAMATISIWRTSNLNGKGTEIWFCGDQQPVILDCENLMLVDKDVLLIRNVKEKAALRLMIRDEFNVIIDDLVTGAKAFALGQWAIYAYANTKSGELPDIAAALANAKGVILFDKKFDIDPLSHRPRSRFFGILRVKDREFKSAGSVEVFSRFVSEGGE